MKKGLICLLVLLLLFGFISAELQAGSTNRFIKRTRRGKLIGYVVNVKFKRPFQTLPSVVGSITSKKEFDYLTKSDVILHKVSKKGATFFIPTRKKLHKNYRFNWIAVSGDYFENGIFDIRRKRGKCKSKEILETKDPVVVANVVSKRMKPLLTRMKTKKNKVKLYVKSRICPREANFITISASETDEKLVGGKYAYKKRRFKSIPNNLGQRIIVSNEIVEEEEEAAVLNSDQIIHVFADPHFSGTWGQFDWQTPGCWLYAEVKEILKSIKFK